jgi:hypothetical protein
MKDLSIGDNVRVQAGKYSQVYSFGHYDKEVMTEYLSINAGLSKPLIISDDHMVFVDNKAIPASTVKVGDRLTLTDGVASVRSITRVVRTGAFAPFTKDGTVVVNDVVASSYISMKQDSANFVVAGVEIISMHQVAHLFQAPHRLACEVSPGFCAKETYKDGLSIWIDRPHGILPVVAFSECRDLYSDFPSSTRARPHSRSNRSHHRESGSSCCWIGCCGCLCAP